MPVSNVFSAAQERASIQHNLRLPPTGSSIGLDQCVEEPRGPMEVVTLISMRFSRIKVTSVDAMPSGIGSECLYEACATTRFPSFQIVKLVDVNPRMSLN